MYCTICFAAETGLCGGTVDDQRFSGPAPTGRERNRLVTSLRKRFTYHRIGYVKLIANEAREVIPEILLLLFVIIGVAALAFVLFADMRDLDLWVRCCLALFETQLVGLFASLFASEIGRCVKDTVRVMLYLIRRPFLNMGGPVLQECPLGPDGMGRDRMCLSCRLQNKGGTQ
jgi:hypothetical protein